MSRKRISLYGAVGMAAMGLIASAASAESVTSAGGSIPDNLPLAPLVVTFNVVDSGSVASVDLTLTGLTHTWAGDLIATLTAPGGAVADIMRRPEDDTPTSTVGDSSNFGGNYRFIDSGGSLATALNGTANVPSGDYQASSRAALATDPNTPVVLNTVFGGVASAGTWTLRVSDNAGADVGGLNSATLNVVIPEPTSLGLIGAAGLGLLRRRRA